MRHTISLSLALAAFWLLNSGHYSLLILSLGLASILLVVVIVHKMDVVDHESQPLLLTVKMLGYYLWLIKQIVLSNIAVVRHIWLGSSGLSPALITLRAEQKTDLGKVIYANSITLTPGTVCVDLQGDFITVHALLREGVEDLEAGEMGRRVCALEGKC